MDYRIVNRVVDSSKARFVQNKIILEKLVNNLFPEDKKPSPEDAQCKRDFKAVIRSMQEEHDLLHVLIKTLK